MSLLPSPAAAEITLPQNSAVAFFQTNGPNGPLNHGDYRTNAQGDAAPHELVLNIACTPGVTYRIELFDPALDLAGNPPGVGDDGVTLRVGDEMEDDTPDDTRFRLLAPDGSLIQDTTYVSGTADAAWTAFANIGPLAATPDVDCGEYILQVTTLDDDQNAWRLRLLGGPDPDGAGPALESFDPTTGPDGIPGTGDESWSGMLATAYEHSTVDCQAFYWFVDDNEVDLYMLNFDMDDGSQITYRTPSGQTINATESGFTVWNDAAPQQQQRPGFADMDTFDGLGDLAGDAIANPQPGLWSSEICLGINNQYSFEVPNQLLFFDPPDLPQLTVEKDDGRTLVNSPDSVTYTITITNQGPGAALPIPGAEVIDILPPGMEFVSCEVNTPLIGSCSPVGTNQVNFNLQAQNASGAYLPGVQSAPANRGTLTVQARVVENLVDGTQLTNVVTVDWTDIFDNDYQPVAADDTDIVQIPTPTVTSSPTVTSTPTPTNTPRPRTPTPSVTPTPGAVLPFTGEGQTPAGGSTNPGRWLLILTPLLGLLLSALTLMLRLNRAGRDASKF